MVMEPPSPACVGREFVRQYYTLLNQAPLHLHRSEHCYQPRIRGHRQALGCRFYSHNSSFVHGGLADNGRDAEAVFGQQEIHQKIMTLNFRDCHAKIRQVTRLRRSQVLLFLLCSHFRWTVTRLWPMAWLSRSAGSSPTTANP